MSDVLPVVEMFGPTIQGEGPAAGRSAAFLRLGGCNLSCSWCDSAYTWDGARYDLREQITPTTVADILAKLPPADLIVVTGGEPLLNQHNAAWADLVMQLRTRYFRVHLETNGTIAPSDTTLHSFDLINVSPKLAHAGPHRGKQNPTMAPAWARVPQAVFKFVCQNADDVHQAVQLAEQYGIARARVWVMPEGIDIQTLNERWPVIAHAAVSHGINASHRLHVLAWNDERGH